MRLTSIFSAAAMALTLARAQSSSAASALAYAEKAYPTCALMCLAELIPKSVCTLTDLNCLCTNVPLNNNITVCVEAGCTLIEQLQTKNVSSTMCGDPVRDESSTPGAVGITGGIIALVAFLMRIWSILVRGGRPAGWDDYTIAVTVLLATPPTVFAPMLGANGLGRDIWTLYPWQIENVLFFYYVGEIFYFAAITMNKISILFFILRVFTAQEFKLKAFMVIGLCVCYGITFVIATAFQCIPASYTWHQLDGTSQGHCTDINVQGWMSAILNIVCDLVVLALPLRSLWLLQLTLKKKIMLMIMFSLGIFVTLVSVIRLRSMIQFASSTNITWDYMNAAYWSTIEMHAGIVCACLPSLRALFVSLGAKILGSSNGASKGDTYGRSTTSSRAPVTNEKPQQAPRQGDEGDFIPLVDVEIGAGKPSSIFKENQSKDIRATTVVTTSQSEESWDSRQKSYDDRV